MNQPDTQFKSIPHSMWWAVQTIVFLGYGDIVPTSSVGKLAGALCLSMGSIIIIVMVLALGGRFFDLYSKEIHQKSFLPENQCIDYEIHYQS